jgi:hypothetical protein
MLFPTISVDNFFNNPDRVRELALSLPFHKCGTEKGPGIWPGYRTEYLDIIHPEYFQLFTEKLLLLLFPGYQRCEYEIDTFFQKINSNFFNGIDSGWIHNDGSCVFAGVIYLNKNIDHNNGTSIFLPKNENVRTINSEYKVEMYTNFKAENTSLYDAKRKESNNQFERTITFNNVYNRMVSYDASQYHMENGFKMPEDEDRLTQVFFLKKLKGVHSPIELSRRVNL